MIKKFCQSTGAPILITAVRGFAGKLAEDARAGRDITSSRVGINYWSPVGELGLGSGIDPSAYGDIVVAKTITLQPMSNRWYQYPSGWYQSQYWEGPTAGQDPYNGGDYSNLVPKDEIGKSEILSEGAITDYEVVYDSEKPLTGRERTDAPHWRGQPIEE